MSFRNVLAISLASLLLASAVGAKDCRKKFSRSLNKLTPDEIAYFNEEYTGTMQYDVDKNGVGDTIFFLSTIGVNSCDDYKKRPLLDKDNYVRITYDNGRSVLHNWRGYLMDKIEVNITDRQIVASGITPPGSKENNWEKRFPYRTRR